MSFPTFKFKELIEEEWEDSTFGKIDIKLIGSPKNDFLFDNTVDIITLKKQLKFL